MHSDRRSVDKIRHPQKRAFLAAYRQSGNIRISTEAAGVDRTTYYVWCERDLVFSAAAKVAKEEYGDLLEAKMSELAVDFGNVTALIVALKMAGRFVERTRSEVSGPDGGPIQTEDMGLSDDDRASRILALVERARKRAGGSVHAEESDLASAAGSAGTSLAQRS